MNGEQPLLLDRAGFATLPTGYLLVATERAFLQHALSEKPLLVRGEWLCRWARDFWQARGGSIREVSTPQETLRAICPALSEAQAAQLTDTLGDRFADLPRPLRVTDLLTTLSPAGPWNAPLGLTHGAEWLLWLEQAQPSDAVLPLLQHIAGEWQQRTPETVLPLYQADNPDAARTLLMIWLGLETTRDRDGLGRFPLPVPPHWQERARERWQREILTREGELWETLRWYSLPETLLNLAAEVTARYYRHHPERLTLATATSLTPFLSKAEAAHLTSLCPPPDPGDLPTQTQDILRWFTERYLPFRQWEALQGNVEAHTRITTLAQAFALWLLRTYPVALNGGEGKDCLALTQARRLRENRHSCVTLWVILDGLPYHDALALTEPLCREPRLSLDRCEPLLTTLPTVTYFCKPALMNGKPPRALEELKPVPNFEGARLIKSNRDPQAELQQAQRGDIFVWSLPEPDETYHRPADIATLRTQVIGQLNTLATRILQAALAIPDSLLLRLVISTDHGRLLSSAARGPSVPIGMEAHGRAAWGDSGQDFPPEGYRLDESAERVFLECRRFGLPVDCAVVWGETRFNSPGGTEQFQHGGLYPEEVLVPWLEFTRDRVLPAMRCVLRGKARAGTEGRLLLHIENPSDLPIQLTGLEIQFGNQAQRTLPLEAECPPMSASRQERPLSRWPDTTQIARATGTARWRLPNGTEFETELEWELESEEMYRSGLRLEDL